MTLNILLLQDILLAPVLTCFQFIKQKENIPNTAVAIYTCAVMFILLRFARRRSVLQSTFLNELEKDQDLQVFLDGLLCLGFGLLSNVAGLSASIRSFAAGML